MTEHKLTDNPLTYRQRHRAIRRHTTRYLLLAIMGSVLINTAITSLWMAWKMPTVVSFDIKGTIDRFSEQVGQQTLAEEDISALTSRFMTTLDSVLQDYQTRQKSVILVAPAVVDGVTDITEEIQKDIAQRMSE